MNRCGPPSVYGKRVPFACPRGEPGGAVAAEREHLTRRTPGHVRHGEAGPRAERCGGSPVSGPRGRLSGSGHAPSEPRPFGCALNALSRLLRVTILALGVWCERYRRLCTRCGPELVSQDIKVSFESVVPEHLRVCQQYFNCQQLRGQQLRRWPCAIFHWSSLALVFRLRRLPSDPGASAKLLGHRGVNPLQLGPPDRVLRLILKQPAHSGSLSQKSWVIETSETASPCWPCCRVVHLPIPCAAYAQMLDT